MLRLDTLFLLFLSYHFIYTTYMMSSLSYPCPCGCGIILLVYREHKCVLFVYSPLSCIRQIHIGNSMLFHILGIFSTKIRLGIDAGQRSSSLRRFDLCEAVAESSHSRRKAPTSSVHSCAPSYLLRLAILPSSH